MEPTIIHKRYRSNPLVGVYYVQQDLEGDAPSTTGFGRVEADLGSGYFLLHVWSFDTIGDSDTGYRYVHTEDADKDYKVMSLQYLQDASIKLYRDIECLKEYGIKP